MHVWTFICYLRQSHKAVEDQYLVCVMYLCIDIHILPQAATQVKAVDDQHEERSMYVCMNVCMYRSAYVTSDSDTSEACGGSEREVTSES
jgi:hypothetical protein